MMRYNYDRKLNGFSRVSSKSIHIGDIWIVKYPYKEEGNYYKLRPSLIVGIEEDGLIEVRKITTKKKMNKEIPLIHNGRQSYLTKETIKLERYMFIRKVGKLMEEIK